MFATMCSKENCGKVLIE